MANVALTQPTAVTGSILTGGKIGVSGTDFYIKVMSAQFSFVNKDMEVSGDGDAAPTWAMSHWMYTSFRFNGFMPAQSVATFPLANLIDSSKNPVLASNFKFFFGSQQVLTYVRAVITRFDMSWDRNGAALGLAMSGKGTDSHPTWSTA